MCSSNNTPNGFAKWRWWSLNLEGGENLEEGEGNPFLTSPGAKTTQWERSMAADGEWRWRASLSDLHGACANTNSSSSTRVALSRRQRKLAASPLHGVAVVAPPPAASPHAPRQWRRWLVLPLHTWRSYSFDFERNVTMEAASTASSTTLSGKYVLQMQCNRRYVSLHVLYC
jgi:hypothetical protein